MKKDHLIKRINELSINGFWHQCIDFGNGIQSKSTNNKKLYSRYYQKGKWDNFIFPLIPFKNGKNKIFLDIGCNAGLYLLYAKEYGFEKIIGIEPNKFYFNQLKFVIDYFKKEKNEVEQILLRRSIGESDYSLKNMLLDNKILNDIDRCKKFSFKEIGKVDLMLLNHVFYWIEIKEKDKFIKKSSKNCRYIIIVDKTDILNKNNKKIKYFEERGFKFLKSIFSEDLNFKKRKGEKKQIILSLLFKSIAYEK